MIEFERQLARLNKRNEDLEAQVAELEAIIHDCAESAEREIDGIGYIDNGTTTCKLAINMRYGIIAASKKIKAQAKAKEDTP